MKLVRPLLFVLLGFVVLLGLVAAVALTPAVQAWAVRRALASDPSQQVTFAELAAGLGGARIRQLTYERAGVRVEAAAVDVDYSLAKFLFGRRLVVGRLVARDVVVDASGLSATEAQAGAAGAPAAAPGALTQVQLPWSVVIGEVDVRGRARLPAAPGREPLPATFQLTGGNLAPGQEGVFPFEVAVADGTAGARVTALRTRGELRVRQTIERTFDQARLTMTVAADGPQFAEQTQLQLAAAMQTGTGGADYTLAIDTLVQGRTERLVNLTAAAPHGSNRFTGEWRIEARTAQVEPFFLGGALPRFAVTGGGGFAFDPGTGAAILQGRLDGEVSALEAINPALRRIGPVRLAADFDVADEGGIARFQRLNVRLEGESPVLDLTTTRAVAIDHAKRRLEVGANGTGEVARLVVQELPIEWVRPFVSGVDVSGGALRGELLVTAEGPQVRIRSVAPLEVDALTLVQDGRRLVDRARASLQAEATIAPDRATVQLSETRLETPAGDQVRLEASSILPLNGVGPVELTTRIEADLPKLLAPFVPLGHVRLQSESDLGLADGRLTVRRARGELRDGTGRRLLTAETLQPISFEARTLALVADPAANAELARIRFDRLPLGEVAALQAVAAVRGELAEGGFTLAAQGARLLLRPTGPIRASGLVVATKGRSVVDRVALETAPAIEFTSVLDWKVTDGGTTLRDAEGLELVRISGEVTATPDQGVRAAATFNADLAALGGQPVAASLGALSAGRASGEIRAALLGTAAQVEARSTLNGLVAREGNQALPVANLSLRVIRTAEGRLTVEAPLLLDRLGQRSGITLSAEAVPGAEGYTFNARLGGEHLELADALVLAGLFGGATSGGDSPSSGSVRPNTRPDTVPAWHGWQGTVTFDLKSLTRGKDWAAANLKGGLTVLPQRVQLEKVEAVVNEKGQLAAQADLRFSGGARPYQLAGNFSLSEFDVGAFLKSFEPERAPIVEGVFATTGTFQGEGATLPQTFERTRGQFQLTSRQGVFRGLKRTSEKVSVASRAVELGAALGSLLGSSRVKEAAEKVAGQTYQIDQLAQALGELPFDQFVVRVNRDEQLHLRVEELSLLSPEVRLGARGVVTHVEGRPLTQQPLQLTYQLAARGKVEQTLGRLGVLDGTKDELGYAKMKDAGTIGGTLSRPDPSALFLKLAEAKLGDYFSPNN